MCYLFSGENRKYKNGHLSGVSRKTDWELTIGISRFNLGQENSHATVLAVGVNYYPDKHLKLMANVLRGEYVEDGQQADTGAALSLRAQFSF
ncbi:porin [Rheinheimera baltica]|uniref:Porin n=1 Tax=Rheinheimera baltica TaxID=67576 RepID=A0ABT9I4E5_9GAMM|nr:porin [Rheinheimera baltica]MDP5138282.1 porin [Rheinheimera baltica]MDP5150433.1 porin [Rheinheimera baltica]